MLYNKLNCLLWGSASNGIHLIEGTQHRLRLWSIVIEMFYDCPSGILITK